MLTVIALKEGILLPEVDPIWLWLSSYSLFITIPLAFASFILMAVFFVSNGAKTFWGWFFVLLSITSLVGIGVGVKASFIVNEAYDSERIADELTDHYSFGVNSRELYLSGILDNVGDNNSIVEAELKTIEGTLTWNEYTRKYENSTKTYSLILDGRVLELVEKKSVYNGLNSSK